MSEETKKLRLVEKLKALGVDAPTGASVEELTKLLEETKAAKKAAKKDEAAKRKAQADGQQADKKEGVPPQGNPAGEPGDASQPDNSGPKDPDSPEKPEGSEKGVDQAAVLVEEQGKFRLFSKAGEFFVLDLYERKIACGIKSADEGHKLLLDLNRK